MVIAMQLHITDKCDQRCKHCYLYNGQELVCTDEMDLSTVKSVIEDFLDCCEKLECVPYFYLTGGDPLLHKDFWEIAKELKNRKIKYSILGNPFHLTKEIIRQLEDTGCERYQLSLDGLKQTHDFIRKEGSFQATLDALSLLNESSIRSAIMTTISRLNYNEVPDLIDIVVANKANIFSFSRYCPNPGAYDDILTPLEYKEFLEKVWNKYMYYKDSETQFGLKDHLWKLFFYEKGLFDPNEYDNPDNLILDGCHCGQSHISLLPNGDVYACRRCDSKIGNIHESSIYDIITSPKLDYYCQFENFESCSKCELKNFCRGCPSVTKSLTGNFYGKDPQCWKEFND